MFMKYRLIMICAAIHSMVICADITPTEIESEARFMDAIHSDSSTNISIADSAWHLTNIAISQGEKSIAIDWMSAFFIAFNTLDINEKKHMTEKYNDMQSKFSVLVCNYFINDFLSSDYQEREGILKLSACAKNVNDLRFNNWKDCIDVLLESLDATTLNNKHINKMNELHAIFEDQIIFVNMIKLIKCLEVLKNQELNLGEYKEAKDFILFIKKEITRQQSCNNCAIHKSNECTQCERLLLDTLVIVDRLDTRLNNIRAKGLLKVVNWLLSKGDKIAANRYINIITKHYIGTEAAEVALSINRKINN